ncbi:MAG: cobalamin biosynthesis protein CbiA [Desulfobacterales bacterium]|jgi:hypothetical protein
MEIRLDGIVIIVGNYGSGKTEIAVNLAVHRKRAGVDVRVADLDLVNPYFRTREARAQLAAAGIETVLPEEKYLNADLPILSPRVAGLIRNPAELTILDVGGNDVGATVLSALADALNHSRFSMLQVINPYRPFTDTVQGCLKIREEIEAASRQSISGLVANPHLLTETVAEDVRRGISFVRDLSEKTGLPLEFATAPVHLAPEIEDGGLGLPLLPIRRQLVPPWEQVVRLPGIASRLVEADANKQGV